MKRALILVITAMMLFSCLIPLSVSAKGNKKASDVVVELAEQTIIINEGKGKYSDAEIDAIIAAVTGTSTATFSTQDTMLMTTMTTTSDSISDPGTWNLWCTLFGHNFYSSYVTVITHCVSPTPPRCLETLYLVETCTRCGYIEATMIYECYVFCCP